MSHLKDRTSHVVDENLYLIHTYPDRKTMAAPAQAAPNHWIVVLDVSGSMLHNIEPMKRQLKNWLATHAASHGRDLITVIWFSGRGECDTLVEAQVLDGLKDFTLVNRAIDRLRTVGMTGFRDPWELVAKVVTKVRAAHPGHQHNVIKMTDGCENQHSRVDVMHAVEKAAQLGLSSATLVACGYYADVPLLTSMAEKIGGTVIQTSDFDGFEPVFKSAVAKTPAGGKKTPVQIGDAVGGFAYAMQGNDLVVFGIENGGIAVPTDVTGVYYMSTVAVGTAATALDLLCQAAANDVALTPPQSGIVAAAYAAVALYAQRMVTKVVKPLLRALGDVAFIEQYSKCFGVDRYAAMTDVAKLAAFGDGRFVRGRDPSRVPAKDAYTILDLVSDLQSEPDNFVLLDDPEFKYERIGRAGVPLDETFSAAEQAEIDALTAACVGTKGKAAVAAQKALADRRDAIMATKHAPLKFIANPAPGGYSVSNIVTHAERPNISINVTREGTVDVLSRLPVTLSAHVPALVRTKTTRSYAIVKDGLLNVQTLPVRIEPKTWTKLAKAGLVPATYSPDRVVLNLAELPIINEAMVGDVSAKRLFTMSYELLCAQARQKVLKCYRDKYAPKTQTRMLSVLGPEATEFLVSLGITDGGFNPKVVAAPSTDVYKSKEIKVSLKGISSAIGSGKVEEIKDRLTALDAKTPKTKPLTAGQRLFEPAIREVEAYLASPAHTGAQNPDEAFVAWITKATNDAVAKVRDLLKQIAAQKFAIAVGQVWPAEFGGDLSKNSLTMNLGGEDVVCTVQMTEPEVHI